jgi:hypothetical protein
MAVARSSPLDAGLKEKLNHKLVFLGYCTGQRCPVLNIFAIY